MDAISPTRCWMLHINPRHPLSYSSSRLYAIMDNWPPPPPTPLFFYRLGVHSSTAAVFFFSVGERETYSWLHPLSIRLLRMSIWWSGSIEVHHRSDCFLYVRCFFIWQGIHIITSCFFFSSFLFYCWQRWSGGLCFFIHKRRHCTADWLPVPHSSRRFIIQSAQHKSNPIRRIKKEN